MPRKIMAIMPRKVWAIMPRKIQLQRVQPIRGGQAL